MSVAFPPVFGHNIVILFDIPASWVQFYGPSSSLIHFIGMLTRKGLFMSKGGEVMYIAYVYLHLLCSCLKAFFRTKL